MSDSWAIGVGAVVLVVGTYLMRWIGPALPPKVTQSPLARGLIENAAVLLLVGVMATSTAFEGDEFAGWSRLCGVTAAGFLAWFRAPLLVVILAAAVVTSLVRLIVE